MDLLQLLVMWLFMSVCFFLVSKIPIGVQIDSFGKAVFSAAVFGILNALLAPFFRLVLAPLNLLFSQILMAILVNAIIFGLAALLVPGFRLRWGIWSAILGAAALALVRELLEIALAGVLS